MWNGKLKAVTFSFDDGTTQDVQLIKLLDKYGMKATFNLNSSFFGIKERLTINGKDIPFEKVDAYDEFPSNPNAMILCYPVIDLCSDFAHKGSGEELFGTEENTPLRQEYCLQNAVSENTPPAFIWHTATDATVPVENAIAFAKAMWAKNRTCELHIYPDGPHGLNIARRCPTADSWVELAVNFLKKKCGFQTCEE